MECLRVFVTRCSTPQTHSSSCHRRRRSIRAVFQNGNTRKLESTFSLRPCANLQSLQETFSCSVSAKVRHCNNLFTLFAIRLQSVISHYSMAQTIRRSYKHGAPFDSGFLKCRYNSQNTLRAITKTFARYKLLDTLQAQSSRRMRRFGRYYKRQRNPLLQS